jgi:hypothetical protein
MDRIKHIHVLFVVKRRCYEGYTTTDATYSIDPPPDRVISVLRVIPACSMYSSHTAYATPFPAMEGVITTAYPLPRFHFHFSRGKSSEYEICHYCKGEEGR